MSTLDTPRTDREAERLSAWGRPDLTKLARELERELTALRGELDTSRQVVKEMCDQEDELLAILNVRPRKDSYDGTDFDRLKEHCVALRSDYEDVKAALLDKEELLVKTWKKLEDLRATLPDAALREAGEGMAEALGFIRNECDWEETPTGGDQRIGPACTEALAAWEKVAKP